MHNCQFCNIVAGNSPSSIVYEDEYTIAFMDSSPITKGHTLVIPKEHYPNLESLDEFIGMHIFKIAVKLAQAIRRSGLQCEGISFFLADGDGAHQQIPHVHMHVFPRFQDDPFHMKETLDVLISREELDDIANSIRTASEKE